MGLNVFDNILGLIKRKRWAKAAKCKRLIKQLRSRLALQKSRRNVIIRQSRADIAQLMQNGQHHAISKRNNSTETTADYMHMINLSVLVNAFALTLVTLAWAGKIAEVFSSWILCCHLMFCHCRKLSVEVHEALSTLIFASSRCGELPELNSIRNLFKQHFGHKFERDNVELLPGNFVNYEIKHNLTISSVTEEVKLQLTNDIATDFTHQSGILKLQLTNDIATEFTHQSGILNQQNFLLPELQKLQGNVSTKSGKCTMTDEFRDMDADDRSSFKGQVGASISKFLLANFKNFGTFWCGSSNREDSTGGSVTSTEINKIISKKYLEGSLSVHIPNGTQVNQDINTLPRKDDNVGHELYSSNTWVANLSSKHYTKKNITEQRSLTSHCSRRQAQIFDDDGQANSRFESSYVHPKLPDYNELVMKFTNLKKKCSQQNSNNQELFKWMR